MSGEGSREPRTDKNGGDLDKRINYLYQSIQDTQNTIRFLDTKASAVLVVHGILIAATVSAAQKLVPVFQANSPIGDIFFCSYFLIIAFQALSVYFVILCVSGRSNPIKHIDAEGLRLEGTFFSHAPKWSDKTYEILGRCNLGWRTSGKDQLEKVKKLDGNRIMEELVGEQLKLSFIRARKQSMVHLAFFWLTLALASVAVWVVALSLAFYWLLT